MKVDLTTLRGLDAHKAARTDLQDHIETLEKDADGQVMADEARADFEESLASRTVLDNAIGELETRARAVADGAADARRTEGPTFVRKPVESPFDLAATRQRAAFEGHNGAYIDAAKRAVDASEYPNLDKAEAQKRLHKLLGQIDHPDVAAERIIKTGSPAYQRAWSKYVSGVPIALMTSEEQRALSTGSDSNGGVALPFTLDPTFVLTSDGAANPVRAIARKVQITTKSWKPVTTAGVTAAYGSEGGAISSDSAPSDFSGTETPALPVHALVKFSWEYGDDYGIGALQSEVGRLFADAKDVLEATKFIKGTGTAANPDEPLGIVYGVDADGNSIVLQNALDLDALDQLTGALGERFQTNAQILGHRLTFSKIRQLGDAGFPANSIYDPLSSTIYGYPAKVSSAMDTTVTAGDEPLIIGDFNYYVIIDRLGMTSEFVPNMVDGSGNLTGQRGIVIRWRNNTYLETVNAFRLLKLY
jgi:HK97 family phage major capsid protein